MPNAVSKRISEGGGMETISNFFQFSYKERQRNGTVLGRKHRESEWDSKTGAVAVHLMLTF